MKFKINELIPGMMLEKPIYRKDGILVLKGSTVLNTRIIQHLKTLKDIDIIDIDTSTANEMLNIDVKEETVNLETKIETEESLKTFLKNPNQENIKNIKKNTKEIIKNIEDEDNFKYNLDSYLNQEDVYAHSVRVACFSILLAKMYNAKLRKYYHNTSQNNLIDLEDIAVAALLHDIGKNCINPEMFSKITKIPDIEMIEQSIPEINNVPLDKYDERYTSVYSYCLLGETKEVSSKAKLMILLSNEPDSENGSLKLPYKFNTMRSPYNMGAKIIYTCDIYDRAMERTIQQDRSLEEIATELGYYAKNGIVNSEIEQLLMNNIPLYPVGSRVKLSSGEFAVVKKNFVGPHDTYKPVVTTIKFPRQTIDLRNTTNITIESLISKKNLFKELLRNQVTAIKKNDGIEYIR